MLTPASDSPDSTLAETTILIVEDNADIRHILDLMLKSAGYQTYTASNGAAPRWRR